jgi:hypothetical protein
VIPDEGSSTGIVRKTTTRYWVAEARGPWRWCAGALGLLAALGAVGQAWLAVEDSPLWSAGLLVVLPFGALMGILGIRGKIRVALGSRVEENRSS